MPATAQKKRYATRVSELLRREYPDAHCSLDYRTPLELLIATILSAQCTDVRVNLVTPGLFRRYRSAQDFAQAPTAKLEQEIKSTGFFRNKAKSIQGCCQKLVDDYGGQVPQELDDLVQLPGVGRKTANVVLGSGFGIPSGVVVDTHVTRLSQRLGLTEATDAVKIEQDLMQQLPKKEWIGFSHRLIWHGRQVCVAQAALQPVRAEQGLSAHRGYQPRLRNRRDDTIFSWETTMILSGQEIHRQLGQNIVIEPFEPANLNPNSYNLTLHGELLTYEELVLDMRKPNRVRRMTIPSDGLVLTPNQLYLARTMERTETYNLVPMIEGRSSIGRLGLFVHVTAGFGDVGFCGYWTLEMFAVQPVRIYAGVPICQIFYHQLAGDFTAYASDKYQNNHDIQPSLLFKELNPDCEKDPQLELEFGMERPYG